MIQFLANEMLWLEIIFQFLDSHANSANFSGWLMMCKISRGSALSPDTPLVVVFKIVPHCRMEIKHESVV